MDWSIFDQSNKALIIGGLQYLSDILCTNLSTVSGEKLTQAIRTLMGTGDALNAGHGCHHPKHNKSAGWAK